MERREVLATGFAAAGAVLVGKTSEARVNRPLNVTENPGLGKYPVVIRNVILAAHACSLNGQICNSFGLGELAKGDASFLRCNIASKAMTSSALNTIDGLLNRVKNSKELLINLHAAAKECAAACKVHEHHWPHGMHLECKACFESCVATMAAIEKAMA